MIYRLIGLGLLVGLLGLGCGGGEEKKAEESKADPLAGNWLLVMSKDFPQEGFHDVTTVMLYIQKKDGKYSADLKGSKPSLPGAKLKSFDVTNDVVHVVLTTGEHTLDFAGKPAGKTIPGSTDFGRLNIEPAQLVRTSVADIAQAPPVDVPSGAGEYNKFLNKISEGAADSVSYYDHFADFQTFCEEHPQSPVSVLLYQKLVQILPRKAASETEIKDFAQGDLKAAGHWGKRMQAFARFNLGASLVSEPKFADVGLKYLKEAETELGAANDAELQMVFDSVRRYADQMKTRQQAQAARAKVAEGKQEEGLLALQKLNEKYPFDPVLMFHHAEAARAAGHPDVALRYYAQISTWPMLQRRLTQEEAWLKGDRELPQSRLLELWVKQHGSERGLEEYKQKIYADAVNKIAEQIGPPKTPPTGNRVSVMELFTGSQCPPCVGADLATGALEHLYPQSHLIVLRYHVHIPGADPMTNPENYSRFETLLGSSAQNQLGTPTIFINGSKAPGNMGGYLDNAPRIGNDLKEAIQPALDDNSPLNLQLTATRHEGEISVSAQLAGVPKAQAGDLRVLLLLAEGDVKYQAQNGILRHEMLVRWMLNGEKGSVLEPTGDFNFMTKTRVGDIREFLESSLKKAEETMEEEFKTIPMELKGLYLIGFVHNPETNQILQAASVPVQVLDTSPELPMPAGPKLTPPSSNKSPASTPKPAKAEKPAPR